MKSRFTSEGDEDFTLARAIAVPGAKSAGFGIVVDLVPTRILDAAASQWRIVLNVLTLVAAVFAIAAGALVAHFVTRPILALIQVVDRTSRGDLDQPIVVVAGDETQILASAVERLRKSLKLMIDKYS